MTGKAATAAAAGRIMEGKMNSADLKTIVLKICDRIEEIKDELTDIDSRLGDGDMGISMSKGAQAVQTAVTGKEGDFKQLLFASSQALNKAAPSTMGTILSSAILSLAKYTAGKETLTEDEIAAIPGVLVEAVQKRGKANIGDKTILDALIPYARTIRASYEETGDLNQAKARALEAARAGMESTKGMVAKTGRASWLGERNKEYPDGGAYMFCKVAEIL